MWKNSKHKYGLLRIILHWTIALALSMLLRIVWRWVNSKPDFPQGKVRYEIIGA